jgi:osmotically-inducible protein OsmY
MTIRTLTDRDVQVRNAVQHQLEWDSEVEASAIGVAARDGVVTLTGFVDTYAGKLAAERAAKRVPRVRAVANDLQVRLNLDRTDTDIATDAARALELRATLPASVQAVVHDGHVTLTGTVSTLFQRAVAEKALRYIKGLKGVVNRIRVAPAEPDGDSQARIARAVSLDPDLSTPGIEVLVSGDTVTLRGTVRSWNERESAERAASHAPGIAHVDNQIMVAWTD